MSAYCLVVDFHDRFQDESVILRDEIVFFEEGIGDEEKGYFFAWLFLDFVSIVADSAKTDVSFLFEDVVGPLDEFLPDGECDLRFDFFLAREEWIQIKLD